MKLNFFLIVTALLMLGKKSEAATTIYVDGGGFSAPYYNFFSDSGLTQPLDIYTGGVNSLLLGETYTFINYSEGHPFYVSDTGYAQAASSLISLGGDGSAVSGIGGAGQSFTLSFNGFNPAANTLTYYCVYHGSMIGTLNVIPEPSGSLILMMSAGLVLVRRRPRSNF